jgi:dipeptide/tripeptide permease
MNTDGLVFYGLLLIAIGLGLFKPALALIFVGVVCLLLARHIARASAAKTNSDLG